MAEGMKTGNLKISITDKGSYFYKVAVKKYKAKKKHLRGQWMPLELVGIC